MKKIQVKSGDKFGRWTVLREVFGRSRRYMLCRCDCGTIREVKLSSLQGSSSKSCGCLSREISSLIGKKTGRINGKKNITHGMTGSPTYITWQRMLSRCENKNNNRFYCYGGRGIKVCERWHKFENFFEDMGKRPQGMTIDRIDNNGNYEPSNCRWSTRKQQANNRSSNKVILFYSQRKNVKQWAELLNINYETLRKRFNRGWPIQRALTTPVRSYS